VQRAAAGPAQSEAPDGALAVIVVRFSVFDNWYEVHDWWEGNFLERIKFGAYTKTLAENPKPLVLFNHGRDAAIGAKILGVPSEVRQDKGDAAVGVVPLLDTTYCRDLLPGIDVGGYGASFMFEVVQDQWNYEPGVSTWNPEGMPERTITEVKLMEFGPVTFPANPETTAEVQRSGTAGYYAGLEQIDPTRVGELRTRITALRTSSTGQAAPAPAQTREAADTTDEAAPSTSTGMTPGARRALIYGL
jgi:hypothetical protein